MDQVSMLGITVYENLTSPVHTDLEDGWIRLLKILPGGSDDEIFCQVSQAYLDQQLEYTAISYTWGNFGSPCHVIKLNGIEFRVGKNLWRFLRQAKLLGKKDIGEALWIDAICINQANNSERSSQVMLMPRIYKTARRVLLWLGPAYGGSDHAMHLLAKPVSYWRQKKRLTKIWSRPTGPAIHRVCERPYWKRLWIFQELMLAQKIDILCGNKMISWKPFRDSIMEIRDCTPLEDRDRWGYKLLVHGPALAIIEQNAIHKQATMWDLMQVTRNMECTEKRDKVFALLGVAAFGTRYIRPDYTMPMSALLNLVLKSHHEVVTPLSTQAVESQCIELSRLFDVELDCVFSLDEKLGRESPFPPTETRRFPLVAPGKLISLWWTRVHGHSAVEDIMSEADILDVQNLKGSEVWYQSEHAVQALLDFGKLDMNKRRTNGQSPLCAAATDGLVNVAKLLLENDGVSANVQDWQGQTALHCASTNGHGDLVKLLLSYDQVHVDVRDGMNRTALHLAVAHGRERIVELLLRSGRAEVNSTNSWRDTPLYLAMLNGNMPIARLLLNMGRVKVNAKLGLEGSTILHYAASRGDDTMVQLLLDQTDAHPDAENSQGVTPLCSAVWAGSNAVVKSLLGTGKVDVNHNTRQGTTALHEALRHGFLEIAELILASGKCDLNKKDARGGTILLIKEALQYTETLDLQLPTLKRVMSMGSNGSIKNVRFAKAFRRSK